MRTGPVWDLGQWNLDQWNLDQWNLDQWDLDQCTRRLNDEIAVINDLLTGTSTLSGSTCTVFIRTASTTVTTQSTPAAITTDGFPVGGVFNPSDSGLIPAASDTWAWTVEWIWSMYLVGNVESVPSEES